MQITSLCLHLLPLFAQDAIVARALPDPSLSHTPTPGVAERRRGKSSAMESGERPGKLAGLRTPHLKPTVPTCYELGHCTVFSAQIYPLFMTAHMVTKHRNERTNYVSILLISY